MIGFGPRTQHSCHQTQSRVPIRVKSVWIMIILNRINGLHAAGRYQFNWDTQSSVGIRGLPLPWRTPPPPVSAS
jgi:hypothetical protein